MAHHKHHHDHHRHRNPFGAGNLNMLAVKVAGGLVGGIAAAVVPQAMIPSLAAGWGGVGAALLIAFGGSWLLSRVSSNFSEGVLIGGTLQAAGRISSIVLKKNLVSFSLGNYGPMSFPVPVPNYNVAQRTPQIPASASAAKPSMGTFFQPGGPGNFARYGKFNKFAA